MSIFNAIAQGYSANKAAGATKDAAKQATNLSREQFERGIQEVAPFKNLGISAIPGLTDIANSSPTPFAYRDSSEFLKSYFDSPEYNALNTQAMDQILRGRSATGSLRSGGTSVDLAKIAPTLGISALDRINQQDANVYGINQAAKSDQFNQLYGIANMGANAATGNQNAGMNFGSTAGRNALIAGQADANKWSQYGDAAHGLAVDIGTNPLSAIGMFSGGI